MNTRARQIKFIILWFFLITSFAILTTVLLLEAYGYHFNWKKFKLVKTGMIILESSPRDVTMNFEGLKKEITTPYSLPKLLPGNYGVEISREGYATWSRNFIVEVGRSSEARKIVLYLREPKITDITDKNTKEKIIDQAKSQTGTLRIKDSEIWLNEKFLTRFSQPVLSAILTSDDSHVVFQIGKDIKVMDVDGSNIINLIELENAQKSDFALITTNFIIEDKLIYTDGNKIFEAKIR